MNRTIAMLGVLALTLTGCTAAAAADPLPKTGAIVKAGAIEHASHRLEPLTVAVVGDSITSWDPPYRLDPAQSWVNHANLPIVGGWAAPGATLGRMDQNVVTTQAYYLVVMGGTNDLFAQIPVPDRIRTLDHIIDTIGAEHVIVSAVAPYGFDYAAGVAWNEELARFAKNHGYTFVDPWAQVRDDAGAWLPGTSLPDHIHPTPGTAGLVGVTMHDTITQLWEV